MKLYYDKKSKDPTYYIQQGFRNGKKTSTRNVAKIGKHSELLLITDDPLSYAKEQIVKFNEEWQKNNKLSLDLKIDFNEKLISNNEIVSSSTLLNIGYFFLQSIYGDLNISGFFKKIIKDSKITFDPNDVNRFLTFSRILEPRSKQGTYDRLDRFYEQPDFNYVHIMRTMDLLANNFNAYISHLYKNSENIIKRDTSVCYFDCSNYFFESESQDEDYIDEVTGEIIKGLRRFGMSKEHRPNPIVQMGLFVDGRGIPLSMCINPGSSNEQTCAIPMEKELNRMFNGKPFIYCADAGLNSYEIRSFNSMSGRAFVVTQSIKKLSEKLQKAVFNDEGFKLLSDNSPIDIKTLESFDKHDMSNIGLYNDKAYKIIEADNAIDVGLYEEKKLLNGKIQKVKSKGLLKQRIIVTFSRKMQEYQREIRNRQIERAKKIIKNLKPETYKKGPNDVTRLIKRVNNASKSDVYVLDEEAIKNEERYDGYYAIATNLEDDAKTIIDINAQRYKIEDCFRVMKTNFDARPVFHRKDVRIISHFMICFTALLVYRLLEAKLDNYGTHFTTNEIIESLKNMDISSLQDICYQSTYKASQVSVALNAVCNIGLDKKYYLPKDLNIIIRNISK